MTRIPLPAPFEDYDVSDGGIIYSHKRRVTEDDVEQMRLLAAAGMRQRDIAARFGVSQGSVSLYLLGRTRHPPGAAIALRPSMTGGNYLGVSLCSRRAGIDKVTRHVHELVALAFLGPPPSAEHEVRHLDGDRTNNRPSNLVYGTAKENAADREAHGRTARGNRNGNSRAARAARVSDGRQHN